MNNLDYPTEALHEYTLSPTGTIFHYIRRDLMDVAASVFSGVYSLLVNSKYPMPDFVTTQGLGVINEHTKYGVSIDPGAIQLTYPEHCAIFDYEYNEKRNRVQYEYGTEFREADLIRAIRQSLADRGLTDKIKVTPTKDLTGYDEYHHHDLVQGDIQIINTITGRIIYIDVKSATEPERPRPNVIKGGYKDIPSYAGGSLGKKSLENFGRLDKQKNYTPFIEIGGYKTGITDYYYLSQSFNGEHMWLIPAWKAQQFIYDNPRYFKQAKSFGTPYGEPFLVTTDYLENSQYWIDLSKY